MRRLLISLLIIAFMLVPSMCAQPRLSYSYTSENPMRFLGPEFGQGPFTPYVTVVIANTDQSIDGFAVTLTYTDSTGTAKTVTQIAYQVGGGAIAFFFTGTASNLTPSARPFKFSAPPVLPN
jgi:hypothetical protein